jgi:hypothetical protein
MVARYRSWETLALGWALIGVALVIVFAVSKNGFSAIALSVAVLIVVFAWLVAIRPAIIVLENVLVIQNVLKRHEIPWPQVAQISSTMLITVTTSGGKKISAWAISSSVRSNVQGKHSRGDQVAFELESYRISHGF